MDKFRNTCSVIDDNKGHIGRPFSAITSAKMQEVRDCLQQSPRKSTRQLSQEVGISRTFVQRIVHKDLTLFPYKIQILQQQTDANKRERVEFCQSISERIEKNSEVLSIIFFSNKAHFHLSGHVNKQNILGTQSASSTHPATIEPRKSNSVVCNWQNRNCWVFLF